MQVFGTPTAAYHGSINHCQHVPNAVVHVALHTKHGQLETKVNHKYTVQYPHEPFPLCGLFADGSSDGFVSSTPTRYLPIYTVFIQATSYGKEK